MQHQQCSEDPIFPAEVLCLLLKSDESDAIKIPRRESQLSISVSKVSKGSKPVRVLLRPSIRTWNVLGKSHEVRLLHPRSRLWSAEPAVQSLSWWLGNRRVLSKSLDRPGWSTGTRSEPSPLLGVCLWSTCRSLQPTHRGEHKCVVTGGNNFQDFLYKFMGDGDVTKNCLKSRTT